MNRARLEFEVIKHHVRKNKEAFIARLNRNLRVDGECRIWTGALAKCNGYPRMNLRYKGELVQIEAHRLFLILKTCAPIPGNRESGHCVCHNRACVRHVRLETRKQNMRDRNRRHGKKAAC